jgi:hypothetical protein
MCAPSRHPHVRAAAGLASGWAVVFWSLPAVAQPRAARCAEANVALAETLDPSWVDALNAACNSLMSLPDRDLAARLEVGADPPGVRVTVRLADGRSAERKANRPEELAGVLEALVTLPPPAREKPAEPIPAKAVEAPTAQKSPSREAPPPPVDSKGVPLALDFAVLGTTHIAGAPATLALGAVVSANVDIDNGWLVGLRGRADPMVARLEGEAEVVGGEFGGGLELARRIRVPALLAIDLGVGVDGLAVVPYQHGPRGGRDGDDASGDVRPRAFGKVWVDGDGLSFSGLLGFELSPLRLDRDGRDSQAAFGVELGAGIGWGGL